MFGNAFVTVTNAREILWRDGFQVAIHLLIKHEIFATLRPDAPRVIVDHIGDHQLTLGLTTHDTTELNLEIDEQRIAPAPGMRENFVRHACKLADRAQFGWRREAARNNFFGIDERIVIRIVLEEKL